jgi:hypothetical protein
MSAGIVTAGMDIMADGVTVRVSVSLPALSTSGPLAGSPTPGATVLETSAVEVQAGIRAVQASEPALRQAFEQVVRVVLETQCKLLAQELDDLRTQQSSQGSAP